MYSETDVVVGVLVIVLFIALMDDGVIGYENESAQEFELTDIVPEQTGTSVAYWSGWSTTTVLPRP